MNEKRFVATSAGGEVGRVAEYVFGERADPGDEKVGKIWGSIMNTKPDKPRPSEAAPPPTKPKTQTAEERRKQQLQPQQTEPRPGQPRSTRFPEEEER